MIDWVAEATVETFNEMDEHGKTKLSTEALSTEINNIFGLDMFNEIKENAEKPEVIIESLKKKAHEKYAEKEKMVEPEQMREIERVVMLKVVDQKWMDHIDAMDELKNGIGLQGYGQKDPVVQYRMIGTEMYEQMI